MHVAIATDGCKIIGPHNFMVQKLEVKIVSIICIVMLIASVWPVTLLPQICAVWSIWCKKSTLMQ